MPFRHAQVLLFDILHHGAFGETVNTSLANHLLLTSVPTEKEVQHNAYHRHEEQDKNPHDSLYWLTIVHDDAYDCAYHNYRINKGENPIKISHIASIKIKWLYIT